MSSLWARVEPLLARVQKPARYIGCEDGAITPGTTSCRTGERWPGCSPTPTPTRSACPTRACRSSTRSSTSATTPSPSGRTRPGSTSIVSCCAARRAAVLGRHPPPRGRLRHPRLQPLLRARLHERARDDRPRRHPGPRRRPPTRGPARRSSAGTAAFNPEPLADFVDAAVLGEGEEVVGEITERRRATGRRRAARAASGVLRELAKIPGVYVPSMYEVTYDGAAHRRRSSRASPTCPATVDKRTVADLADWPYPKQPARPADRGRPRPPQRRGVPRLHARLPLLPGGHDHPPGPRAPGRAGAHDGPRGPAPHRATTRSA